MPNYMSILPCILHPFTANPHHKTQTLSSTLSNCSTSTPSLSNPPSLNPTLRTSSSSPSSLQTTACASLAFNLLSNNLSIPSNGMFFVSGIKKNTKTALHNINAAKKKYTPYPMDENICGVKRATRKFQNQLLAAANAWASVRTFWSNISEFKTQGVGFHVGE